MLKVALTMLKGLNFFLDLAPIGKNDFSLTSQKNKNKNKRMNMK